MVRLFERPVTPREAEGRVQTAELLKWMQYSKYVPATSESRLLQLGIDELFGRTIDMTTFSVAFSVRLWAGWMKLPFTKRWLFPAYAGLVIADRRRALNTMKSDSTYATLIAISQLDSPMGREAKRLVDKSAPRLEKFKRENSESHRRLEFQLQRYLRQIFFFYGAFGSSVGAVVSHLCLWTTLHEVFEGSAFMHTFTKGNPASILGAGGDFSIAHEIQQQQILEAVEKKRLQDQQQQSSSSPSSSSSSGPNSVSGWVSTKGLTSEEAAKKLREFQEKQLAAATEAESKKSSSSLKNKDMKSNQQDVPTSKVFANLQVNVRWWKWQIFEISSLMMDEGSTLAFSVATPVRDVRNDFVANELRKCGSAGTLSWWYPARLWWTLRWLGVSKNPPSPPIPQDN